MVWTDFVIVSEVGFETASEIEIEVVAAIAFSEVAWSADFVIVDTDY